LEAVNNQRQTDVAADTFGLVMPMRMRPEMAVLPESAALMLIDVQIGSITEHTEHLLPALGSFLDRHQSAFSSTVATRFVNTDASAIRKVVGTTEMSSMPAIELCKVVRRPGIEVITKNTYSAVTDELLTRFQTAGVTVVYLSGVDTDMCVLQTAVDLFEAHLVPRVLTDLCASTGGESAHTAGLLVLRRSLGDAQIIESSHLDDGRFHRLASGIHTRITHG
jgi:nicotinamidase-related amidase